MLMKKSLLFAMAITTSMAFGQQQTVDFEELTFPESQNYWNGSDESGFFQSGSLTFSNTYNTSWSSWSGFAYSKTNDASTAGWGNQYSAYAPVWYWNGSDELGGFVSNGETFPNSYNPDWSSWNGFAYSRSTDTETAGWGNQYSAFTGSGNADSPTFAVKNGGANFSLSTVSSVQGVYVTNTTYAALSMRDGDMFAKQFGSSLNAAGEDDGTNGEDWFLLTITGLDAEENEVGSVEFYLADFRFAADEDDYIVDSWQYVDLTSLGTVAHLSFQLTSSDVGNWGMNTPNYFALDDLEIGEVGETLLIDFEDLPFSSTGDLGSEVYAVWNSNGVITFDDLSIVSQISVTNTTYAALSMRDGDMFAKQFGSSLNASGEDDGTNGEDWFLLTVTGLDAEDNEVGTVEFYLADFRFENDEEDYIVEAWQTIDLSSLGAVKGLSFQLTSSDVGEWGMNTPNYFALDNIVFETVDDTGFETVERVSNMTIFPNPATTHFTVIYNGGMINNAQLVNLSGQVVREFQTIVSEESIDVKDLESGMYFMNLNGTTQRIVIR
jgi:hypothetical protein